MIVDQSGWGIVRVTGGDRVRFLQGMCMGDVQRLPVGGWLRTATLNVKGRVLTIYDVLVREEDLLLLTHPGLAPATAALLERHAIADDVATEVVLLPLHRVWDTPEAVWTAPPVLAPLPGAAASPTEVLEMRIRGGLPIHGVDVTDENFPFETPLDRLIDYKKGCYVGQEPVARVAARGTPSRRLRGLSAAAPIAAGSPVARGEKVVGHVTSASGTIALAYLARDSWDAGTHVQVEGGDATVVDLPFR
ncbi:MAG TPA: glycine cleavage T C-terminal barrel domain-containing protein [Kofleriaceae bacterium]|nr:glycine cleavage T C-terminal barrel domain-containing protein [Kofleriaceae bacterium]